MDPIKLKEYIDSMFNATERSNASGKWDELGFYLLTMESGGNATMGNDKSKAGSAGILPNGKVYDSTGPNVAEEAAKGIRGLLTNPATKWFNLRFSEESLNDNNEAVLWLQKARDKIFAELSASNFDNVMASAYRSYMVFGNAAVFMDNSEDEKMRFTAFPLSSLAWAEGLDSKINKVARKFTMSAEQIVEIDGWTTPKVVQDAARIEPHARFEIVHLIRPRSKSQVKLNRYGLAAPDSRPIEGIYMLTEHPHVLEVTGYYEMPLFVSRYSVAPGEIYGRGPGHLALPDVKTLNYNTMLTLDTRERNSLPPTLVRRSNINFKPESLRAGAITKVTDLSGIIQLYPQGNHNVSVEVDDRLRQNIRDIFMINLLKLPPRENTGEMTAYEVSQRIEEISRMAGPLLSRLSAEILDGVIVRAFSTLFRNNKFEEMPAILREKGVAVDIRYTNQVSRAQQVSEVTNIQSWVRNVMEMSQFTPEVLDVIDVDGAAKHIARLLNVPEEAIRDSQVVEQIRGARVEQQQQQVAVEQGVALADINSKLQGSS